MTAAPTFHVAENDLDRYVVGEVLRGESYPAPPLAEGVAINVIADIGAHVGAAALYFHHRWPTARIICWEPFPESVERLRKNVGEFAEVRPYGLEQRDGRFLFVRSDVGDVMNRLDRLGRSNGSIKERVEVRSAAELNDLLPDVIKLDTEGCELPIMFAASKAFQAAKVVYVEYHNHAYRRQIDERLGSSKILFRARTNGVNRGELAYIDASVIDPVVRDKDAL